MGGGTGRERRVHRKEKKRDDKLVRQETEAERGEKRLRSNDNVEKEMNSIEENMRMIGAILMEVVFRF
jgi:hypothetical protein